MQHAHLISILRQHQLRITDCRLAVLEQFINAGHALSQKDLEIEHAGFDRVTLYRTLQNFQDKGLLHRIPNDSGFASYGLCFDTCTPAGHTHDHPHFKCNDCGHIECLEDSRIPYFKVPGKYQVDHVNMIIEGTCLTCQDA